MPFMRVVCLMSEEAPCMIPTVKVGKEKVEIISALHPIEGIYRPTSRLGVPFASIAIDSGHGNTLYKKQIHYPAPWYCRSVPGCSPYFSAKGLRLQ